MHEKAAQGRSLIERGGSEEADLFRKKVEGVSCIGTSI